MSFWKPDVFSWEPVAFFSVIMKHHHFSRAKNKQVQHLVFLAFMTHGFLGVFISFKCLCACILKYIFKLRDCDIWNDLFWSYESFFCFQSKCDKKQCHSRNLKLWCSMLSIESVLMLSCIKLEAGIIVSWILYSYCVQKKPAISWYSVHILRLLLRQNPRRQFIRHVLGRCSKWRHLGKRILGWQA